MQVPPEYESTWIKFSLDLPRIDKLFVTIYVSNLNSTGPNVNTRDVHFVFHDTSGETALYDHYKDKKHFEVKVETSNNESTSLGTLGLLRHFFPPVLTDASALDSGLEGQGSIWQDRLERR